MKKEKIFSKFNTRNFNNELEEVLTNKPFSENIKNNILNIIYKIEEAYQDYKTVKIEVQNEKDFLEKVLKSIKNYCNSIQVLNTIEMKEKKYLIDYEKGNIEVIPNNVWMLQSIIGILKINNDIRNDLNVFKEKPIYDFLKIGNNINNVEVIRDFNGWSWITSFDEIENVNINLIYQNLQLLLGNKFMEKFIQNIINNDEKFVSKLQNELEKKYNKQLSEKIVNLLEKIAIIEISNIDEIYKKEILEIKQKKLEEYNSMDNKKEYLKEISNIKKENIEIIKNIDKLINDAELLRSEYKARNSVLKNSEKIFSVSCLVEILNNERKEALEKISNINALMDPKKYVQKKDEIKNVLDYLCIDEKEKTSSDKFIIEMQKVFIECFFSEINTINDKTEIIKILYKIRYYINIIYDKNKYIKDIPELKEEIEDLKEKTIEKLFEYKLVFDFSGNDKINKKIISNILNTRIINLQTIFIILKKEEKEIKIGIYDEEDELNSIETIIIEDTNKINLKTGKKIKLFL